MDRTAEFEKAELGVGRSFSDARPSPDGRESLREIADARKRASAPASGTLGHAIPSLPPGNCILIDVKSARFVLLSIRYRANGSETMSRPTAIDLFSGCGGLTLGLRRAGFKVIGAVDNDPLSVETYRANHGHVHVWEIDIRRLTVRQVRRTLRLRRGKLDLLAGCPPCQGFSTMRTLNRGRAARDSRNKLIFDFLKFVRC
jgi:hypothetical protein